MSKTILVVEDEKEIRDLLAHCLHKEGFAPILAPDGETAIAKARKEKPDLVLLDILLPKADGLEVLRAIRSSPGIEGTPVVMLTAKGDETDRIVGLELGADDYITKPFSPREVVARIKAVFRRSRPGDRDAEAATLVHGDLHMDVGRHEVRSGAMPSPSPRRNSGSSRRSSPLRGASFPARRSSGRPGGRTPT